MNEPKTAMETVWFESVFRVRSYELDGFGHLNHAVYLNYFEQARFDALSAGGFGLAQLTEKGWQVYVVRVEVDFRREARLGEEMVIRTRVSEARTSSMTLHQVAADPDHADVVRDGVPLPAPNAVFAEAKVVVVWIGPDRAPMRIPSEVRAALGIPSVKKPADIR